MKYFLTLVLFNVLIHANPRQDLTKPISERGALLFYVCDHEDVEWTQTLSEKRKCPACGDDHECGRLIQVLPHPDAAYATDEYLVPNPLDPVSGMPTKEKFHLDLAGRKVYFSDTKSMKRFSLDSKKWEGNLPLRPELFGLKVEQDTLKHHDHHHDHDHGVKGHKH